MTNAAQGMVGRAVTLVEHLPRDKFYYLCMTDLKQLIV